MRRIIRFLLRLVLVLTLLTVVAAFGALVWQRSFCQCPLPTEAAPGSTTPSHRPADPSGVDSPGQQVLRRLEQLAYDMAYHLDRLMRGIAKAWQETVPRLTRELDRLRKDFLRRWQSMPAI